MKPKKPVRWVTCALLIALMSASGASILLPHVIRRARRWQAVRVIEAAGGQVSSAGEGRWIVSGDGPTFSDDILPYCNQIGKVEELTLCNTAVTDEGLSRLVASDALESLVIHASPISGDNQFFRSLHTVHRLNALNFSATDLNDIGIEYVSHCRNVTHLNLERVRISRKGLAYLCQMRQLDTLFLSQARLPEKGASQLGNLPNLAYLDLSSTNVTDDDLASLQRVKSLLSLCLDDTAITNEGIRHLSVLPKIYSLCLKSTEISDEALIAIRKLETLKVLDVCDTNVTRNGAIQLRDARPKLRIILERPEDDLMPSMEPPGL